MKHSLNITILLALIFFTAQIIGLFVINEYIDHKRTASEMVPEYNPLPLGIEQPEVQDSGGSAVVLMGIAILAGTGLMLLIIRLRKIAILKVWLLLAVTISLTVALNAVFARLLSFSGLSSFSVSVLAIASALILGIIKVFRPTTVLQNIAEIFMYGGLASIFIPLFKNPIYGIFWSAVLLILISIYDIIAVWKTKHMVALANFQTKEGLFAGLFIPYEKKGRGALIRGKAKGAADRKGERGKEPDGYATAVLGGGDIAFPLLFAGAVMQNLMIANPEAIGFLKALIIPVCATIALLMLLIASKEKRFYPAMPFITAGCLGGYLFVWLIGGAL